MVHNAAFLAALSLGTTALTVEAMVGRAGSFHPFIHEVARPHPGQAETARIIASLVGRASTRIAVTDPSAVAVRLQSRLR